MWISSAGQMRSRDVGQNQYSAAADSGWSRSIVILTVDQFMTSAPICRGESAELRSWSGYRDVRARQG
jgi:hypothetical protein